MYLKKKIYKIFFNLKEFVGKNELCVHIPLTWTTCISIQMLYIFFRVIFSNEDSQRQNLQLYFEVRLAIMQRQERGKAILRMKR